MFRFWLFAILIPAFVWADCTPRKPTPNEAKTAAQVLETAKAAFAPAPAGWKDSLADSPFRVSPPCELVGPAQAVYLVSTHTYSVLNPPSRREYPEEQELRRLHAERDSLTRTPDSVRQKINAIRARASEKMRASKAAERAGNQEEARRMRQEYETISLEEKPVMKEFQDSIAPKLAEIDSKISQLQKALPRYDTRVFVALTVSAHNKPVQPDPQPGKGLNEDVYVWRRAGAPPYAGAVNCVILKIEGWPDYRETVTRLIDQEKLAALVK